MRNVRARRAAAAVSCISLAAIGVASCVTEPTLDELAHETVVISQFAPNTNFASFKTFAITDTITIELEQTTQTAPTLTRPANPQLERQTLDLVASEMTARGYKQIDKSQQPDLGVGVTGVVRLNSAVLYGAWWGFGAATGSFWGYGGVPFSSGITSTGVALWRSGALVVELYDLRQARAAAAAQVQPTSASAGSVSSAAPRAALLPGDAGTTVTLDGGTTVTINAVWAGYVYGVIGTGLTGTSSNLESAILDGVRQAFDQSPYLATP